MTEARRTSEKLLPVKMRRVIELRLLTTVVSLAIYFTVGWEIINVSLYYLGLGLGVYLGLTLAEYLLQLIRGWRRAVLHLHFIIDYMFLNYLMYILGENYINYLSLYLLLIVYSALFGSAKMGYIMAGLSSLSLSAIYGLACWQQAPLHLCLDCKPIALLAINSSFFFLAVTVINAGDFSRR